MAIENFKEIEEYFNTNKDSEDVKGFMNSLVNVDKVKSFLETNEDGKKYLNSYGDTRVTKGIETFKQNTLPKLIQEELKKANPTLDERDLKIQELQNKFEASEKAKVRETLTNKALKVATEKKLPVDLIQHFLGQDEESTMNNLASLEKSLQAYTQQAKEEVLKGGSYVPPKDTNNLTAEEQAQATINKYFGV